MKNLRKIITAITAAAITAMPLAGCQEVGQISVDHDSSITATDAPMGSTAEPAATTVPVDIFPDYPITFPEIEQQSIGDLYEAENCILGTLTEASEREGYSGRGYVTGFSDDTAKAIVFEADVPSNQHYDLSFCIASDAEVSCTVLIGDKEISSFKTKADGAFTIITLYGNFILNGETQIQLRADDGNIDIDYMKISDSSTVSEIIYEADGELSNENAAEPAKELMQFLTDAYGDYVITGQYVSSDANEEMELICQTVGKYPVIRFSGISEDKDEPTTVEGAKAWHENGGIIGFVWHWKSPGENGAVYSEQTDFKLSDHVTDEDIAKLSAEELEALVSDGTITSECRELMLDIDSVAAQLKTLSDAEVPVLWRPLHEGSGEWFWWGASGADAYKWLWDVMYTRMTEYHELNNLIWIWNGQSANTLVDKSTFDIAALDLYVGEGKEIGSCYEQFAALQKLVGTDKLIAVSECSSAPDIDACFRDNAVWSFFGQWYGGYLKSDQGTYSEKYMSKDNFIRTYNSSGALTLDEYKAMDGTYQPPATTAPAETTAPEAVSGEEIPAEE